MAFIGSIPWGRLKPRVKAASFILKLSTSLKEYLFYQIYTFFWTIWGHYGWQQYHLNTCTWKIVEIVRWFGILIHLDLTINLIVYECVIITVRWQWQDDKNDSLKYEFLFLFQNSSWFWHQRNSLSLWWLQRNNSFIWIPFRNTF